MEIAQKYMKTPMVFDNDQQISLRSLETVMWPGRPVGLFLGKDEANKVVE